MDLLGQVFLLNMGGVRICNEMDAPNIIKLFMYRFHVMRHMPLVVSQVAFVSNELGWAELVLLNYICPIYELNVSHV